MKQFAIAFHFVLSCYPNVCRLLGYEGLEVINPDGGLDDAEEEALRGRWKQEVRISESSLNSVLL